MEKIILNVEEGAALIAKGLKHLQVAGFRRVLGSNGARARHEETGVEIRAEWRLGLDGVDWEFDASIALGGRDHTAAQARAVAGALMVAADAVSNLRAEFTHVRVLSIVQANEAREARRQDRRRR